MGGIFVLATLPMKDGELRDKQIRLLTTASEYAFENGPSIPKYIAMLPRDKADANSLWVFEEYENRKVLDEHMEWQPVKDMVAFMTAESPLSGAPTILELSITDLSFTREEIKQHADPYITVAEIEYHPDTITKALPYWKAVVDTSRKESGTLAYGVYRHPFDSNKIFTVEIYESKEYLWDVHAKSDAVAENVKNTKDMRKGLQHTFLRKVGGHLYPKL
ncbi:hypothetical protein GGR57DRAFT_469624 [Xylariaceae sp. FL1272]|nr:hypothetical protein GGR57DRAFT_469624 [Xylariaceae sp. FL1272]